jgi:putative flippase GtrA
VSNKRQMISAGLGGVASTAADMSVLALLVECAHLSVPVAAFLASAFGAIVNFTLNKYVAFKDKTPLNVTQLGRFGGVAVATALLMALGMKIVAVHFGVPYMLAKVICAASVFIVWTYPAQRRLVFARLQPQPV